MANPDYDFTEGFDKYGPIGEINILANLVTGDWTTTTGFIAPSLVAALSGTGCALSNTINGSQPRVNIQKTLPTNYARGLGGTTIKSDLAGTQFTPIMSYTDNATTQVSLGINNSGRIVAYRGDLTGTLLGTSAESVTAGSVNCIEWDFTIHPSAGIVKVWLNGTLTTLNLTGQNTRASANSYFNILSAGAGLTFTGTSTLVYDHIYHWLYIASGGTETPALTNPIVQTDFPTGDSAVAFTFGAAVLGTVYRTTANTNAPGANRLSLRKYTPEVSGTVSAVNLTPGATSAGAKCKPVIYSDSAGAPNTLLSTGAEVVGMTSGTVLSMPFTTPQAVTAGTQYWIGFITDTSVALQLNDAGILGYGAANTYTSGAPGTAPAMTSGLATWQIWGTLSAATVNWGQVDKNPALGLLSYNFSSTVSQEDLLTFPALAVAPAAIYTVGIKGFLSRSDTGARTANLRMKSSATESSGNITGISPPTTFAWCSSYFRTDPNTGAAWGAAGLNASKAGYQVAS